MNRIILSILLVLTFSACTNDTPSPIVLTDCTPKLIVRNDVVFVYNENQCQLGFNRQSCTFRMMTDNMSEFVFLSLESIPTSSGCSVKAKEVEWTTKDDVKSKKNIVLDVLKLEDDTIWLWCQREQIALVVRILE